MLGALAPGSSLRGQTFWWTLVGALDILGGTDEVDLLDILLGWCSGLCLIWKQIDPPGDLLVVCLGISLDWWCGIHCFWTHPIVVCLVVST